LETQKLDIKDIQILSASDADEQELSAFYSSMYPLRAEFVQKNWKWINRSYYLNDRVPLVLVSGKKVIAHAGIIPVSLQLNGLVCSATWFIDLAVLPEYQRSGYGSILVKKRMEYAEIQMTFPNQKSRGIFLKLGWQEYTDSFMSYILIRPFNFPGLNNWLPPSPRSILNRLAFRILKRYYMTYSEHGDESHLMNLSEKTVQLLIDACLSTNRSEVGEINILRDEDYIRWRILNSPDNHNYYIYNDNEFYALIFFNKRAEEHIDVLLVSDTKKTVAIRKMLCRLALIADNQNYSFIRFYSTDKDLKDYIKKIPGSYIKRRIFVFNSKDQSFMKKMTDLPWNLALIDSDFEFTN